MKKIYVKPEMAVEKIAQSQIICTSPPVVNMNGGSGNQIEEEINVW